ncbi:MAG: calcium-binding protein [Polyangiales bacterium]
MRAGSSYVATAVALGIITFTGCAADDGRDDGAPAPNEDWGDSTKYPEIGGAFQSLDALTGTCAFANGIVTVTSTAAQTILIGKRAVDSVILVNGATCETVATPTVPATPANATTMKRLVVNGAANAAEVLVFDFLGGFFAPGVATATSGGIVIDLGAGLGDGVAIRGTDAADTIFIGSDGLAFNADNYKDITFAGVETLSLALAGGNDVLTATNATATKGVNGNASIPLTLFGGAGNDVLLGGDAVDTVNGGPGNDTLSGGALADTLNGDDGADIIQGTAAADGSDTINCGNETPTNTSIDIVSYDKRTNVITANLGSNTAGESGETDAVNSNCEGVTGGSGNDSLTGDANDNVLSGGPGNDTLVGAAGNDTLNGGDGNDSFSEGATSNGGDIFNGGAGIDTVDYGSRTNALAVTMDGSTADDGEDNEADNVKADVENIIGGTAGDDITGNTLANTITGGLGADTLSGGVGDDIFLEGAATNGGDVFQGGAGIDLVDYSLRTGNLTVTMGDDTANDGLALEADDIKDDVENLFGGAGADNLTGNALANLIEGGLGDDTISGLDGNDRLDGTDSGSATNNITCGLGDDFAFNKGAGTYAADCEIKGN